jgi:hypothetical protein
MARATNLADAWSAYAEDRAIAAQHRDQAVQGRRDFMSGALAVLELQRAGATREAIVAEIVAFGRAVGTAAESAAV